LKNLKETFRRKERRGPVESFRKLKRDEKSSVSVGNQIKSENISIFQYYFSRRYLPII
jgi:hypothetical protein